MGKGNSNAEYMRGWRKKNHERLRIYRRENYLANLEENRAKGREKAARRRAANPEHIRRVAVAWREANPDKIHYYNRKRALSRYGITPEEYDTMLGLQGGGCAICGSSNTARDSLAVDHDHDTGRVRGLLCSGCNTGLGMFGDDLERLRKALRYLEGE